MAKIHYSGWIPGLVIDHLQTIYLLSSIAITRTISACSRLLDRISGLELPETIKPLTGGSTRQFSSCDPSRIEGEENVDTFGWGEEKAKDFSVAAAYSLITREPGSTTPKIWNNIWKLKVPSRIHTFLWLASKAGQTDDQPE